MERWTEFTTSPERALDALPALTPQRSAVDLTHNPKIRDPRENGDASASAPALLPNPEPGHAAAEPPMRELDVPSKVQPTTEATEIRVTSQDPSIDSTGDSAGDETPKGFLIVDDNKINLQVREHTPFAHRLDQLIETIQLLSAFMKKMRLPYKSASDGLEALQTYSATPGDFRCILMGMLFVSSIIL